MEREQAMPRLVAALQEAVRRLRASGPAWQATRDKISDSKTSWLVASWHEPSDTVYDAPPTPLPCTVYAADGSQIVSDRHDIADCYLLNIGLIALRYGTGERALLTSRPHLALPDDELLDEFQGEQATIVPKRLAIRRLLEEMTGLIDLMADVAQPPALVSAAPTVRESSLFSAYKPLSSASLALFDGSLILWPLETEKEEFRAASLRTFEAHLDVARELRVPLVGYISDPRSRDVVNSLRVFHCPHERANCDTHCPQRSKPRPLYVAPECAGTEAIHDADLFAHLLQPGERSPIYGSSSKILLEYRPENQIHFFYLHTGREVARIEVPAWVCHDPQLLALTHALCYDQACKGDGYPVALAEAHEQAVVRAAEKSAFFAMMQRTFVTTGQPVTFTQKAVSKRARRV